MKRSAMEPIAGKIDLRHFELITEDLTLAEGPVALRDGSILVCDVADGTLKTFAADGELQYAIELGGGPNGAALGPDGRCYVCNNGGFSAEERELRRKGLPSRAGPSQGCIQAVDLETGVFETLYESCGSKRLSAPNDLVFDADGCFYFTDHGNIMDAAPQIGTVCYASIDGSMIRTVIPRLERPNGIGLSPNGDAIYVAGSDSGNLWRFPITSPDVIDVDAGVVHSSMPGIHFDSLAVQEDGSVCVACPRDDMIMRFAANGTTAEKIDTPPAWPTNICFSGQDRCTAFVTGMFPGALWRADWDVPGLKLYNSNEL